MVSEGGYADGYCCNTLSTCVDASLCVKKRRVILGEVKCIVVRRWSVTRKILDKR